jgi:hypothetical protein
VKHASEAALFKLVELIEKIRKFEQLKEKKFGIFYFKSAAFLHFHEDPAGLFVDIKLDDKKFDRFGVNSKAEQKYVVQQLNEKFL